MTRKQGSMPMGTLLLNIAVISAVAVAVLRFRLWLIEKRDEEVF